MFGLARVTVRQETDQARRSFPDLVIGTSYLIFGTTPWSSPWLTEQHLAHALSRTNRVMYVEPPLTPLAPLRYGLRPETGAKARLLLRRWPRRAERVEVFQPLVLPPRSHPAARRASAPLLRQQVAGAAARSGLREPVVLSAHATPGAFDAVAARCRIYLVKDWVEAGADLLGRPAKALADERDAMCKAADVVCCISAELQRSLGARGVTAQVLKHGFQTDLAPRYDGASPPAGFDDMPRPLIGYAGRIDGRLDFEALAAVAEGFPRGTLLLVGPVSPRLDSGELRRLTERRNVRLLRPVGRDALPAYLAHLDCAVMPYREGEWARHGSPLKLWDYLYAGPPIVGSGYSVLREYPPPLVRYASGPQGFVAEVKRSLAEPEHGRAQRRSMALGNSWDTRAAELEGIVRAAAAA
jgi:glycosyltransferase involved in cell wall biosynthesis